MNLRSLIVLIIILSGFSIYGFGQTESITVGSGTWNVPAGVYSITVEVWGGGGGGGGSNVNGSGGSGGGAGGYSTATIAVNPGDPFAYSVGTGGTGGSPIGGNGGAGLATTFGPMTANGGTGGGGNAGAIGVGGTASGGDTNTSGGDGGSGGAAGGNGGDSPNGGLGGAGATNNSGSPGNVPGGGGGGGEKAGGTPKTGGGGARGQIDINYVVVVGTPNNITAPSALFTENNDCNWISLDPINVQEGDADDFAGPDGNYVLMLPAGYIFNETVGTVAYTPALDLDGVSLSYVAGDLVITLSTDGTTDAQDDFTISGLQIKSSTAAAGAATLKYDFADSDDLWGAMADEIHANFTCNAAPVVSGGSGLFTEGDATPVTIAPIVINETVADNFRVSQTNETYVIKPPVGFTFDTGTLPTVTAIAGDITINGRSFSGGNLVIDITEDGTADQIDEITITGLDVILGAATGGTYNIVYDCASSTGNWGMTETPSHGLLSVSGVRYSVQTGDWGDPATWDGGVSIPASGDKVRIQTGHNVYINNTTFSCAELIIEGLLEWRANRTLTVTGDLTVNGGIDATSAFDYGNQNGCDIIVGGNCYFNNGFYHPLPGGSGGKLDISGNLICTGINTLTQTAANQNQDIIVGANLIILSGTTTVGGCDYTVNGTSSISGTLNFGVSSTGQKTFFDDITINPGGFWDNDIGEDIHFNSNIINNGTWLGSPGAASTGFFGYETGGAYSITGSPVAFNYLDVNNGTSVTNYADLTLDGDGSLGAVLTDAGGSGVFTNENGGKLAVYGSGNCIDIGTFNASIVTNSVQYAADANQNIRVPTDGSYHILTCKGSLTKSIVANTVVNSKLYVQEAAILDVADWELTGAAGLQIDNTGEVRISHDANPVPQLDGLYELSYGTGTLTLYSLNPQIYNNAPSGGGANTVYNLRLEGGSGKTIDGITVVNGDITVTDAATIASHDGFVQATDKTFYFTTVGTTVLDNASTANITIGNFYMSSGILDDAGININVNGATWTLDGGTFTATGSATFNNSTAVLGAATTTFNDLFIVGSLTSHPTNMGVIGDWDNDGVFYHNNATVSFSGAAKIVAGNTVTTTFNHVAIPSGLLTQSYSLIKVVGDWTRSGGGFSPGGNTVEFTGGAPIQTITIIGGGNHTFSNLLLTKTPGTLLTTGIAPDATGLFILTNVTIVSGTLDMNEQSLAGPGGFTMTGGELQSARAGTIPSLSGTYSLIAPGGGTVTLDGTTGDQTLNTSRPGGTNYYNLILKGTGNKILTGLAGIYGNASVTGSAIISAHDAGLTQVASKTFSYSSDQTTTLLGDITVGNFVLNSAIGTFSCGASTLSVQGTNFIYTSGTLAPTGTVEFIGTSPQTISGNPGFTTLRTNKASEHVTLLNDIDISTLLDLTSGNIIAGYSNKVAIPNGGNVSRGTGFVEGNLQKNFQTGANMNHLFEIGTGSRYAPVEVTFSIVSGQGDLICSTTAGDHPDIYASDIDLNKTVNRYWTLNNTGITYVDFNAVFNFTDPDKDGVADESNFEVRRYDGVEFFNCIIDQQNNYYTSIVTEPDCGDFIVGEKYNPDYLTNAVSGAMTWSDQNNWIKYRTGVISSDGSTTITGTGTYFVSGNPEGGGGIPEISVGDVLLHQNNPGVIIGTVTSVIDDVTCTVDANAAGPFTNRSFGIQAIPNNISYVVIGNPYVGSSVTVNMDALATIFKLQFKDEPYGNTLNNNGFRLIITNNAAIKQPSADGFTNLWDVGTGRTDISGNLKIASDDPNLTRVAKMLFSTAYVRVLTNIVYDCNVAAGAEVTGIIEGTGNYTFWISGQLVLNNGSGTFNPGVTGRVFYYRSTSSQNVIASSEIRYNNLLLWNTHIDGAQLCGNLDPTNLYGYFYIRSGSVFSNGYAIIGTTGKLFKMDPSTNFYLTNTSPHPTGFTTYYIDPTSNTYYHQDVNTPVKSGITYGNLFLQPQTDGVTLSLEAGTTTVAGNLTMGDGLKTGIIDANTNGAAIDLTGDFTLNTNTTFEADDLSTFSIEGNWNDNGGTFNPNSGLVFFDGAIDQTVTSSGAAYAFGSITVFKSNGTLSCAATPDDLTINNFTNTLGDFNAPSTLTANGNITLTAGNFNAGSTTYSKGSWTNNGGTFNPGAGTVIFNGTSAQQINGTSASQTFGNISVQNTGQVLSSGGSTTEIITGNLSLPVTAGTFNAPATLTVGGNFYMAAGTFNAGSTINLQGNATYDAGTLSFGAGTVFFNGTSDQTIGGAGTWPTFNNLTIDNSSASGAEVTLNKPISVAGTMNLTLGNLVTTATNLLMLGTTGTTIGGSNSSFVKGPMRYTVNDILLHNLVYPVGKGTELHLAKLNIQQALPNSTTYTGEYKLEDANALGWTMDASIDHVSSIGYWEISKAGAATIDNASVQLYYLTSDDVNEPSTLTVAKGSAGAWTDIGGTAVGSPAGDIISGNFPSFSKFSLANKAGGTNPLPVELISFDATYNPATKIVDINWQTASEINNDFFVVLRTQDGYIYEEVDIVTGKGNSNSIEDYISHDYLPLEGTSFYVLKQVDFDGTASFSDLIPVEVPLDEMPEFMVYPNPMKEGFFYLETHNLNEKEENRLLLTDMYGREVYSSALNASEGFTLVQIDARPGIYLVTVQAGSQILPAVKLVVKDV